MYAICSECGARTRSPQRGDNGETLCEECVEKKEGKANMQTRIRREIEGSELDQV